MRATRLLFSFLLGLGLFAAGPEARTPPEAAATAAAAPAAEPLAGIALAHRVEALKKAILSGSEVLIEKEASSIDLLRRTHGTTDMVALVESLALWAHKLGAQGAPGAGQRALDVAERWGPYNTSILSTRIALKRQSGLRGYIDSLPEVIKLNRIRWQDEAHRWLWIVQHAAWLRLMATLLLWGWALALAMRYRRVLRHLLEEPLERRGVSPHMRAVLAAVVMALPVVAGLDPGVAAMLWLWLLVPFLATQEITVTVAILALQLVHPVLAGLEPLAARQPRPSLRALMTQPQPRLADRDRAAKVLPPEDREFLAGWIQLQAQDWAAAEKTFQMLRGRPENRMEVLNNLGVALYQLGRKEEASKAFDDAFQLAPQSVEVLVNQSILAFERLDTVTGTGKHEEGRNADPVHYAQLMAINRVRKEPRAFPLPLADTPVRVEALEKVYGETPSDPGNPWLGLGSLAAFLVPLVAIGLIRQRVKQSVTVAHPAQCVRCGEPFHTTDSPDPGVCPKCHHLFVLKDGLHQESKKKKLAEVGEYQAEQRWIHRSLVVFAPGADKCFMGETVSGIVEFLLFTFAAGLVFATGRTVRYPGEILPDPASTWLPIGLFLLLIVLVRSWAKLVPRKS